MLKDVHLYLALLIHTYLQTFEVLERESIKLGLKVNETKTKYIHLRRNKKRIHELKIGEYKFEGI
jgi:hypothetical protein